MAELDIAPAIDIRGLCVDFPLPGGGTSRVLDDVSLTVQPGESVGIVGESGSGKSMLALSLLRLTPPTARVSANRLAVHGAELSTMSERELGRFRGGQMGLVVQDPMAGLNPVRRIGSILCECVRRHSGVSRSEARERSIEVLRSVGVPSPAERLRSYPHQLSGGLRQRVMVALALINHPSVIIADEPTTALDATVQAQVLKLLGEVMHESALVLITHDLAVAAEVCDRIVVLYAGRVLEFGATKDVLYHPTHPYTRGLLAARPSFSLRGARLHPIEGNPPQPGQRIVGCRFRPRCPDVIEQCAIEPGLVAYGDHAAACWVHSAVPDTAR